MFPEFIRVFFENQILDWPQLEISYKQLKEVTVKKITDKNYEFYIQHNTGRKNSTKADISENFIKRRKCFLCYSNRPSLQKSIKICNGNYELLINPYPIFPMHLTISSTQHIPQQGISPDIIEIAKKLNDMIVFMNGSKAGASAPDHYHFQAVPQKYLPLVKLIENMDFNNSTRLHNSLDYFKDFPFIFYFGKLDKSDLIDIKKAYKKLTSQLIELEHYINEGLFNAFFWLDINENIKYALIPRKKHRPDCYYRESNEHFAISPGCIDMAGVIIVPDIEDFNRVTAETIKEIYQEVGITSI